MMGMWLYTKRTLPDYLHRPCIFRRGQLSRFFFWVSWEVFHMVLCLIICIVRTSFGGESYRVFFSGFPGKFFTRNSAWFWTVCGAQIDPKTSKKASPWTQHVHKSMTKWVKKGTRGCPGTPLDPKECTLAKKVKKRDNAPTPGEPKNQTFCTILHLG